MRRSRLIGIVGGISYLATLEYYRLIIEKCKERDSADSLPEILIYSLSFDRFKKLEDSGDRGEYINYIGEAVRSLQKSGAECIVLAANSPHSVLDELRARFDINFLSVLESAFSGARSHNLRNALLLGNKYTMQSIYYKKYFCDRGIDLFTPCISDQDEIESIINSFTADRSTVMESVKYLRSLISNYPADGLILGCMRLPLIFGDMSKIATKVINPLELHVQDIISYIYDEGI